MAFGTTYAILCMDPERMWWLMDCYSKDRGRPLRLRRVTDMFSEAYCSLQIFFEWNW